MSEIKNVLPLRFGGKIYIVKPNFSLAREIEEELGGIAQLQDAFFTRHWRLTDLVVVIQILLQASGETVDYMQLGDIMIKEGVSPYLTAACNFLALLLGTRGASSL